ncbi:twin-arginine translocase subunit TatC [Fictibacillus phosphorivorans]|uniref:twin-arginine translocase subunit TatC n=1 Tax=Fictibacillus phosphorivorans TaxID=1221500 RepID=UPI0020411B96|nr:twin-arginine translocase subunit TatC [Fictibacillus phosphorivorans]MCM3719445.1 twin-arginine translocase subunit TatC [Fictibacillus phosphorivorans]MCM3777077.1 twin-arginine translocase subunit TatC [Fictibacillus phosphorivorans]
MNEKKDDLQEFTWLDHLNELRKKGFYIVIVFLLTFIVGFFFAKPAFMFIKTSPGLENVTWNVFHPADAFKIYMKFALVNALIFSIPWTLLQIWFYIRPGLHKYERKEVLFYIPLSFLLFLIGLVFTYFLIVPFIFSFISYLNKDLGFVETYGVTQYFSFLFNILIPISLVFQLPALLAFFTRIGLLNPQFLVKIRKHAYMALIVLAALITPPDLTMDITVALLMIILYEISVIMSKYIFRKHVQRKRGHIKSITQQL